MGLGGFSHWIIILIIILVLFGAGRVSNIMGELGKGIKSFKEGMADEDDDKFRRYEEQRRTEEQRRNEKPNPDGLALDNMALPDVAQATRLRAVRHNSC